MGCCWGHEIESYAISRAKFRSPQDYNEYTSLLGNDPAPTPRKAPPTPAKGVPKVTTGLVFTSGKPGKRWLGHNDVSKTFCQVSILSTVKIAKVACGTSHTAALSVAGDMYTWGSGSSGCLGHGNKQDMLEPSRVVYFAGTAVKKIACGPDLTTAIADGAYVWGTNKHRQLGLVVEEPEVATPTRLVIDPKLTSGSDISDVQFAARSACALLVSGAVFGWGAVGSGVASTATPTLVEAPPAQRLAAGGWHAAIVCGGVVYTWGEGTYGQLGRQGVWTTPQPVALPETDVIDVGCGWHFTAALTARGRIYTWGHGSNGQLGRENTAREPALVGGDDLSAQRVKAISCGTRHMAAITDEGRLFVWGYAHHGQLGNGGDPLTGGLAAIRLPIAPSRLLFSDVACGSKHSAVVALSANPTLPLSAPGLVSF
eukprot:gnl/Hemi2/7067_TR2417_c0_g1_i1.p1 gnl/Hemi2/7067_TR2417_c0_g1~~gnl/Hemi2/7067_TR2417_c0_g1_i1.p1  ORF type:complete len:427 (-),score=71.76 gnl/Hemi2/7067_TR2417_c0_g1_i1:114-1394(-)